MLGHGRVRQVRYGRLVGGACEALMRESPERDAEARRDVADRVEGTVVADDLDDVTGPSARQPDAGGDGDAQVAPVTHADRWRAVNQVRSVTGEQSRGVAADHLPVPYGDEIRAPGRPIDGQIIDHAAQMLWAARVLHVE